MNIPRPLRVLLMGGAAVGGGVIVFSAASSVTLGFVRYAFEANWRKTAKPCHACREKGFYPCKLCKGNGTIEWSPLYDPIFINPCKCPTCDGRCIQRCLNCLGKCYF